jgi:hypothetical protein
MTIAVSSAVSRPSLTVFPSSPDVRAIIQLALAEDIGRGDITTESTVPSGATATAEILQKAPGTRTRELRWDSAQLGAATA